MGVCQTQESGHYRIPVILNTEPRLLHKAYATHIQQPAYVYHEPRRALRRKGEIGPWQVECAVAGKVADGIDTDEQEGQDEALDPRHTSALLYAFLDYP